MTGKAKFSNFRNILPQESNKQMSADMDSELGKNYFLQTRNLDRKMRISPIATVTMKWHKLDSYIQEKFGLRPT